MATLDLLPIHEDIECKRGTTRRWQAQLLDLTQAGSPPLNIAGSAVHLRIKTDWKDATTVTFEQDGTIIDSANGLVEFTIPVSETFGADGDTATLVYEITLVTGAERVPWWDGKFIVRPSLG